MFNWTKKDDDKEDHKEWLSDCVRQEKLSQEEIFSQRMREDRLRLLKMAASCSIPGESASRTIERAIEFKKYIYDGEN
jgi:hypothetical protein